MHEHSVERPTLGGILRGQLLSAHRFDDIEWIGGATHHIDALGITHANHAATFAQITNMGNTSGAERITRSKVLPVLYFPRNKPRSWLTRSAQSSDSGGGLNIQ